MNIIEQMNLVKIEFKDGLCDGLGVMLFSDGSKYEGEFSQGKYHHYGLFTRCDRMKYEVKFFFFLI
jgi:hypothetical protein